jgi:flagellar basal-body rod protein FlgC
MTGAINAALTGAAAALRRQEVAANNTANIQSRAAPKGSTATEAADGTPFYRPGRAVQTSLVTGGVRTSVAPIDPSSVQRYEPNAPDAGSGGTVDRPNVDPVREQVESFNARRQLSLSLKTVQANDELLKRALDLKA